MKTFIIAAVLLSSSCFAQVANRFHTRIHNKLAISGFLCKGGEEAFGLEGEVCQAGEWLINVDNINVCSDDGMCTEMYAPSFIANLERANIFIPHKGEFFDIVPVSKVSGEVNKILKKYWLHDLGGKSQMVKRKL